MRFRQQHIEELAELPEDRALATYLSELCWGRLAIWMRFAVVVVLFWAIGIVEEAPGWRSALPVLAGALLVFFFVGRRRGLERLPFLRYGYAILLAQIVLARLGYLPMSAAERLTPFDFMLAGLLMVFPLPTGHHLALLGVFWLPMAVSAGWGDPLNTGSSGVGELIAYTIYAFFVFLFGRFLYRRRVMAFLESWQRARTYHLEGRRMRDELDQARRIQLSMLPQHDPHSDWLDIAGSSQPANEVGGDYYGFFDLGGGRQAVVVADVSGHGVASGLLLAGVRGCLVMLHDGSQEAVPAPQSLLARLDKVVRTVGGRRTFVTMVYTLFEGPSAGRPPRLTLATAGHPPPLHWRAGDGSVGEIVLPSLPLGTTLGGSFPQATVELAAGDVLVFATDGIAEAMTADGRLFGEERLAAALRRFAPGGDAQGATAAALRDALLAELAAFLGGGEVQDDVTLVVVRVKPQPA